jgi:hypothetical protein
MNRNNIQIGGQNNRQRMTNNERGKNWQDNIWLYVVVTVIAGILVLIIWKIFFS